MSAKYNGRWGVGGLYPSYDLNYERIPLQDRTGARPRTALAFKGKKVYLIASESLTYDGLRHMILTHLKPDGAIAPDGGGSTQLYFEGKGIHSSRKLNNMIGVKMK